MHPSCAQQEGTATAAHAAKQRKKQLRYQVTQAEQKEAAEAKDLKQLKAAYLNQKHQIDQAHATNQLLQPKAKSVAKFAKSVATQVATVNTGVQHGHALKVGATQVDAELQTDAIAISQLANREADREQEEKQATALPLSNPSLY